MKFDKVLVPLDGSARSDIATEIAINSAKAFGSTLTFLNVVDFSSNMKYGSVDAIDEILELQTEGQKATDRVDAAAKSAGVEYTTKIVQGVPWEVIVKMSKDYDQIILGVTGKGGVGRIGQTIEKVIENSKCPVLTIKSGSRRIEHILLPVANHNSAAVEVAIQTAKKIDGTLTVFSVDNSIVDDAATLIEEVADKCRSQGVKVETKLGSGNAAEAIIAQSGMFDLVIMGTVEKGEVLHGGVTEDIILHASCPVTVVREKS